jgi:hypothetical protein
MAAGLMKAIDITGLALDRQWFGIVPVTVAVVRCLVRAESKRGA